MHSHVDFVTVAALSVLLLFTLQNNNQSLTCAIDMPSVFESSTRSTILALTTAATVATAWPVLRSRRKSRQTDVCDYAELCKQVREYPRPLRLSHSIEFQTPRTIEGWRRPGESLLDGIALWELLRTPFLEAGIDIWRHNKVYAQAAREEQAAHEQELDAKDRAEREATRRTEEYVQ